MLIKRGEVYHLRLMHNGKLYQQSLRTKNKNQAIKQEAAFRMSLVNSEFGIHDHSQAPTLEEFKERLFAHLRVNVMERSLGFYEENYRVLMKFKPIAEAKLSRIDLNLIERFIQWRLTQGVANVTVNHSLRTLRRALILAKDWNIINQVPKIKLLRGEKQRDYVLTEPEIEKISAYLGVAYPKSLMQHLLPFLVDTGLRISEACNLRREDVHLDTQPPYIHIHKGKSKFAVRDIPLTARAAEAVRQALKQSRSLDCVWTQHNGRARMTRHYPSEMFRVIRMACNLEDGCVLHSTRHTFCTRLGDSGASAFVIQKLAGHSSITISQRYVHPDKQQRELAIAGLQKYLEPKPSPPDTGVVEEI